MSCGKRKDTASQIKNWWEKIEQKSIELAMDYEYLFKTDISDFYGSIYSHSIAWAIHGKQESKQNKGIKQLIGNVIDNYIQDMSHGQTNGIPQGSKLMDFIAEIVVGYADLQLSEKLKQSQLSESYQLLRYRDDYRIFVNNPQDGQKILKALTEVLYDLGLKLNPSKTTNTDDLISGSIKPDKLFWLVNKQYQRNWQKQLLIIHNLAMLYPNSASVERALMKFKDRVSKHSKKSTTRIMTLSKISPLLSIVVDIAYHNPRTYAVCSGVLSELLNLIQDETQQKEMIDKIRKKLERQPHTGHLDIYLQRMTLKIDPRLSYKEPICSLIADKENENIQIRNNEWLKDGLIKLVDFKRGIDRKTIKKLPKVIQTEEIDIFTYE